MSKQFNKPQLPDFTDKRVIDRHMDAHGLHGVSRREFLAFSTASAVAGALGGTLGASGMAIAATSGKIAHLQMSLQLEYVVNADVGSQGAAKALGLEHTAVDGQFNSERQLNQFEQQATAGVRGVMLHAPGGGSIKRIAVLANQDKVWLDNTWGTLPWYTPFEAGDYYTMYAVPEEFSAHRGVTRAVCQAMMDAFGGGEIVGVTGVEGNSTDLSRSRGRDAAIAEFPKIKLVGQLPGKWNREDSHKAMEDLISRFPNLKGVIGQNDDVADGCIAALKAAGIKAGQDVFVSGADGTTGGTQMIKQGLLLATSANVPQYMGAMLTARLYDVINGWRPRAAERMMSWRSVTTTKKNVDVYLARYVNNGDVPPFDYKKLSKVAHPQDWDPQAEVFPMDIDLEWSGIPKPDGWQYPADYVKSRKSGEAEVVRKEYADHYKTPMFGPAPTVKL